MHELSSVSWQIIQQIVCDCMSGCHLTANAFLSDMELINHGQIWAVEMVYGMSRVLAACCTFLQAAAATVQAA